MHTRFVIYNETAGIFLGIDDEQNSFFSLVDKVKLDSAPTAEDEKTAKWIIDCIKTADNYKDMEWHIKPVITDDSCRATIQALKITGLEEQIGCLGIY